MGVGVLERDRTSRPQSNMPVILVSGGPGVRLLLWMIVSSPPVISESWVSSVMIGDRDVSGRRYTGNFFVLLSHWVGGYLMMLIELTWG